jgi:hypothetical protein
MTSPRSWPNWFTTARSIVMVDGVARIASDVLERYRLDHQQAS